MILQQKTLSRPRFMGALVGLIVLSALRHYKLKYTFQGSEGHPFRTEIPAQPELPYSSGISEVLDVHAR